MISYKQASNFTEASEAMAVPFLGFALVPSNLNKFYGILNHVLALVSLSTFLNGLSAPQKVRFYHVKILFVIKYAFIAVIVFQTHTFIRRGVALHTYM